MNSQDKERMRKYYADAFEVSGPNVQSLHWSDELNQEVRFDAICSLADMRNCAVLDVGCGFADLYKYFLKRKIEVTYTGIDVMPEFIVEAKRRYPDVDVSILDMEQISDEYDYIIVSGAFNFASSEGTVYYMRIISKLFNLSRKGLIFNLLDAKHHESNDIYLAYDRREMVTFAESLTPHVKTADGYLPWDFTIAMYK
jgi:cyclopropane fatty-acyl-phospholipid synthase-like methyltransferase